MKLATDAIKAGADLGPKINAQYTVATMDIMATQNRNDDDPDTSGTGTAPDPKTGKTDAEKLAAEETATHEATFAEMGISLDGGE